MAILRPTIEMHNDIEWTGLTPRDWQAKKARWLFNERNERGNPFTVQLLTPSQKYGVLPQSLFQEISGTKPVQVGEEKDLSEFKTVRKGDFCISLSAYMGGFEYSDYDGVISPAYHSFYKASDEICNAYYKYLFKSQAFIDVVNLITPQSVRVGRNTSFENFKDVVLPVPSLGEQQAIADYLDGCCSRIDEIISEVTASIEEYKSLKQSVIFESVTGKKISGINYVGSNNAAIGEIPSHWGKNRVKEIAERIVVGVVITPANYFDDNGTIPFLRGINVKEYVINSSPMVYISEDTNQILSKSIVHTNDLVIVRDGAIGVTAVVPKEFDGSNVVSMIIVTPGKDCDSHYLCYLMNSYVGKIQFDITRIGAALTHTSVKAVSNIEIPLPPLEEQKAIVKYLDKYIGTIDSLISEKQALIEDLLGYKKSLIFEMVTGKRKVV